MRPDDDSELTPLWRHYRPEPLTRHAGSALLGRVREQLASERSPRSATRIGLGSAAAAVAACAITNMRRLGYRSASAPANGPMNKPGPCCATVTSATAAADSVNRYISQDCATIWTHIPSSDIPCPV